jgi:hypothetical protein
MADRNQGSRLCGRMMALVEGFSPELAEMHRLHPLHIEVSKLEGLRLICQVALEDRQ